MSYAVVCFLDESVDDSEVVQEVPISWLKNNNTCCMWPPSNYSYHIINGTTPTNTWKLCPIRCDRICDSLADARRRCTKESSSEDERGRGLRKKFFSKHLIGHSPKCPSPPMPDQSSEDSENAFQSWPQKPVVALNYEPNKDCQQMTTVHITGTTKDKIGKSCSQSPVQNKDYQYRQAQVPVEYNVTGNFMTVMERKIDKLTDLVGRILVEMESIRNQQGRNEPFDNEFRNSFPFNSIESLEEFEEQLHEEDQQKKLKKYFQSIGGFSAKDFHSRAMTKIFTNSLAMTCSWKGFKNNHKVEGLIMIQCLYDVIAQQHQTTMKEFEILTRDWLRHAKQRKDRETK